MITNYDTMEERKWNKQLNIKKQKERDSKGFLDET